MIEHAIEIAMLLASAYLMGCMLGYGLRAAVSRSRQQASAAIVDIKPATASAPSPARRLARLADDPIEHAAPAMREVTHRPRALPGPRFGRADELRRIKGIGQKTESALHDLGIYHFDQIAAWSDAEINWLEGRIAMKGRIRREQWVEQAALLSTATKAA